MCLQTLSANENVNDTVVNQVVLATERTELPVENGWLATTLWSLVALDPIGLATNFVQSVLCDLREPQNSLKLPCEGSWTWNQLRLRKLVRQWQPIFVEHKS